MIFCSIADRQWLAVVQFMLINGAASRMGAADIENRLFENLLYDYNKIARPVTNNSEILTVGFGASLIRIIDVQWTDSKLVWDPVKFGNIKTLHIPSDQIWTPDFVLYNNAAGDPDVTIFTDALVTYDGHVLWQPPAIYKSFCPIDVTWFPYDSQNCEMKFGAWSYTGYYVDMKQMPQEAVVNGTDKYGQDVEILEMGMDLSFYYQSAEWDLLSLSSARHAVFYTSCCGPEKYVDITYYFVLRRKTLFFTCYLIIPCFLISILTTMVFYLSDHKITFSISILVTLTVFFLVLIDIIPPTSLVIPMFGRYLITTMILVSVSIFVSVIGVNFRFRSGSSYVMSPWTRKLFLCILPKILFMQQKVSKPPSKSDANSLVVAASLVSPKLSLEQLPSTVVEKKTAGKLHSSAIFRTYCYGINDNCEKKSGRTSDMFNMTPKFVTFQPQIEFEKNLPHSELIEKCLEQIRFIADHFHMNEQEAEMSDEWKFVAMVLDRLFLVIFSILNIGTFFILIEAPTLYDTRWPLNASKATKPLGQGGGISLMKSIV